MSTIPKTRYTAEQYLSIERAAQFRSEFFRGEMFAMVGASRKHNLIAVNISRRLNEQFDGRKCEVYQSDMRVKVNATGLYTYPDVVATCDEPQFEDDQVDTLLNPKVIVEVLSPSTELWDRGKKFKHYRNIPSLRECLNFFPRSQSSVDGDNTSTMTFGFKSVSTWSSSNRGSSHVATTSG